MADTFAEDKKTENNLADYDYLISTGLSLASQVEAWNGKHITLHAEVPAAKQAELDSIKAILVQKLIAALDL